MGAAGIEAGQEATEQSGETTSEQTLWIVTAVSDRTKPLLLAFDSMPLANAAAAAYAHWTTEASGGMMPVEVTKDAQGAVPSVWLVGRLRIDVSRVTLRTDLPPHLRGHDPREVRSDPFLGQEMQYTNLGTGEI
jgi:hypothetical protein